MSKNKMKELTICKVCGCVADTYETEKFIIRAWVDHIDEICNVCYNRGKNEKTNN